jgi:hypothetical protein
MAWLGLVLAGCQTTSPTGEKVTAFVTVEGRSLQEIRLATIEVFQAKGFQVGKTAKRDLVFERVGSTLSSVVYGSWMDPKVWVRVKIHIEETKPELNVVEGTVFYVQNRGDSILEEEGHAYSKSKQPLQEILAQVKARLAAPAPSAAPR